ncbi:hypothetical protein ROA7450_02121 [Roseovarius albus]|uniref:Lipid/polyisoprenoid-binding YceI-like domain-containing protein n=1 Tax=Roseovarius albus TaxID=1247867 RepID=A0A1X6ZAT2_9RHOB|nr:YceI family protein [Roseovarius albus]SLN43955.1 hypothetical protein ROA7450_02121 [Roseovarius albus]
MNNLVYGTLTSFALALTFTTAKAEAVETYVIDQGHTEVFFGWSHAGVSRQHGEFTRLSGAMSLDPENPAQSSIEITIDATSLSSGFEPLDTELISRSWLDVETYPEIHFKSTSVELTGGDTALVSGELTLHGVTKTVTLDTKLTHRGAHPVGQWIDYYKGPWVAFHATTDIDHTLFGVGPYSTGRIFIEINTELKGQ